MKLLLLLAMVMTFGLLQVHGAFWNFAKMIEKATGKNAALGYGAYGCYCGLVNGGGRPKDATDRCCVAHDCCYARLNKKGCKTLFLNYQAYYRGKEIFCGERDKTSCRAQVCKCDKAAARCFAKHLKSYNKRYQFYDNRWCKGKSVKC